MTAEAHRRDFRRPISEYYAHVLGRPITNEEFAIQTSGGLAENQAGGIRLLSRDLPDFTRGRLFRHVAVTFDRRVAGPVLVGAGRYLGVGLLTPAASGAPDPVATRARGEAPGEDAEPAAVVEAAP